MMIKNMESIITYKIIKKGKNCIFNKYISWVDFSEMVASDIKKKQDIIEWEKVDNRKPKI